MLVVPSQSTYSTSGDTGSVSTFYGPTGPTGPTGPFFFSAPEITERGRAKKKKKRSIFISHSRADLEKLVKPAAKRIKAAGFEAYIASLRVTGKNPADKIVEAISSSKALFAIITENVTEDRNTRDWVLFEMGVAKSLGRPVFGWKTPRARVPEPVKQITDYFVFDSEKSREVKQMLQMVRNLARTI